MDIYASMPIYRIEIPEAWTGKTENGKRVQKKYVLSLQKYIFDSIRKCYGGWRESQVIWRVSSTQLVRVS